MRKNQRIEPCNCETWYMTGLFGIPSLVCCEPSVRKGRIGRQRRRSR